MVFNVVFIIYNTGCISTFVCAQFVQILYRTVIRPIVTYASETWVLKEAIIQKLLVFERKNLKKNIRAHKRKPNMES